MDQAIQYLASDWHRTRAWRDADWRAQLAREIVAAADEHGVPPLLLAAVVYAESSFVPSSTGKKNEKGLTQVHGEAAIGCDLSTTAGQLSCGARWLASARFGSACAEVASPWQCALARYQGGDRWQTPQARRGARYRLALWVALEDRAERGDWNAPTYARGH